VYGRTTAFRLEKVLDHRQRLTEEAEQALARREQERLAAEEALATLRDMRSDLCDALDAVLDGDATLDMTTLYAAEIRDLQLRHGAFAQGQAVEDAESRSEEARQELLGRRVDQKALEKLREKHIQQQRARLQHAEAQLIDEIATMQHGKRQRAIEGGTS
jgi:flagellar export protein FliJ